MPLYPRNAEATLTDELFANPGSEYRGTPFWAWNGELDPRLLCKEMDDYRLMGLGGGHLHPRTGLATPYLGEAYLAAVKAVVGHCKETGMLAWLYDEDRWPSGAAGGLVTRDPALRQRYLRFTPHAYGSVPTSEEEVVGRATAARKDDGIELARYTVALDGEGRLATYRRLAVDEDADKATWYAYREVSPCSSWFNDAAYLDTLNPTAVQRFIEVTHDAYAAAVGDEFGTTVPAIFTDEPQFHRTSGLPEAAACQDCLLPWTDDLPDTYRAGYGEDLLDRLPELFWELSGTTPSPTRWRFYDHVTERFAQAFGDQIGAWCEAHGIAFTGHYMVEHSLNGQSMFCGECMRHYRAYQIPGMDLLCDAEEYTTAKQCASVAHQDGRETVMSELYGVTNWDFPFTGHLRQGNWQAALGVGVRVHHLTMMTMKGNAKRDYPASIGYQSPWYREYPAVEDHFSRVNAVLARGTARVRVAVIHPIESFWLLTGPAVQNGMAREELEGAFQGVTRNLLFAGIDFDFVAESLLPAQCPVQEAKRFTVGRMAYDAVVVPQLRTIRRSTLERLVAFREAGGLVLFAGGVPDLVDVIPCEDAARLAADCLRIPLTRAALAAALEHLREVDVLLPDGNRAADVLHQQREDGAERQVFLCTTRRKKDLGHRDGVPCRVRFRGTWAVIGNDTVSGDRRPLPCRHADGWTEIAWIAAIAGSLLVTLRPTTTVVATPLPASPRYEQLGEVGDPSTIVLDEPNVLVLDLAESRIDEGAWHGLEEIQRAENVLRKELGWRMKTGQVAQPWTQPVDPDPRTAWLRFTVDCLVTVAAPHLGLEDAAQAVIELDGSRIDAEPTGWWTDESIGTVPLPDLAVGFHQLVVGLPFTEAGSLETCYLLGDFGVAQSGRHARLIPSPKTITWGDWCRQGLPFFGGNLTCRCRLTAPGGPVALRVDHFGGPVLAVDVDGERIGVIHSEPYRLHLGDLAAGEHELAITVFGNRVNCFGALHNADPDWRWWGPNSWTTTGDRWAYEYQLRKMGVLTAPVLERIC